MVPEKKRMRLLEFLGDFQNAHGYFPSVREVMDFLGVKSTNTAHYHLSQLEKGGFLRREPGRARAFQLTERARDALMQAGYRAGGSIATAVDTLTAARLRRIPMLGRITAGVLDLAIEAPQGELDVGEFVGADESTFALRVEGDSMTDAGIYDGDLAIVRRQSELRERDIGVLIVDGETTCKFIHHEPDEIVLRPANPAYAEIRIPRNHPALEVCGRVIGVVRRV